MRTADAKIWEAPLWPMDADCLGDLHDEILHTLKYLRIAEDACCRLNDGIQAFVDDYYARVGDVFERLMRVKPMRASGASTPQAAPRGGEAYLKSTYRRLMKEFHPDAARGSRTDDVGAFMEARRSYLARNAPGLVALEIARLAQTMPAGRVVEKLEAQLVELRGHIIDAQMHWRNLRESPACLLMQKSHRARAQGIDLAAVVREEAEALLAAAECREG